MKPTQLPTNPQKPERDHHILIVDDNPAIHDDFRKILGRRSGVDKLDEEEAVLFGDAAPAGSAVGFDLDFASQGFDALRQVTIAKEAGRPYSVVFMDVRMPPGMDGIETTARLWEVDPDLQVVICTAFSDHSWEDMIRCLGHTDRFLVLKKPFDMIEVLQCAHALAGKWSLLQQTRAHTEGLELAVERRTEELLAANSQLELQIAERRRADEALRFTQFAVDNASDAMFRVGSDSRILYANASTCHTLGYQADEINGLSVLEIAPQLGDDGWELFWQSLSADGHRTFETTFVAKDGTAIAIELTASFFNYDGRELLCASARDITVRRRILDELATARDLAFESVRSKSRFLANMSHEIRTPMNGVIGMAELLLHTNLSFDQRDYVDTIRNSADLLLHIINDILDSAKIESDSPSFSNIDFDLEAVIDGTLDIVGGLARKKNLELVSYVGKDVFPYLRGDAGRFRQVLTNLLGNAIKFTHQGEVVLTVSCVEETAEEARLLVEVRDTGIGIAPDVSPRIFEPFVQADGSAARPYGGTGLGLSICRQIVDALGGTIGVESEPGVGSRFWFTLAFQKQATPARPAAAPVEYPGGLRVLIVDDNATNRKILGLQLTNLTIRSSGTDRGEEALEMLRAEAQSDPFHIALLDMQMPGMDGMTLAGLIKLDPAIQATRLIILSSLGEQPTGDMLTAVGVEGHLVKPLKQSRLEAALATPAGLGASARPDLGEVAAPALTTTEEFPPPAKAAARKDVRILVAEDNQVNQKVTLLQLQHLGYAADLANDGHAALGLLEKVPYDLILMDCQMPVMDGYTATQEIRRKYSRPIPIIAMTANAMKGDREKCLRAGMNDFVSKPIDASELADVLDRWIEGVATVPRAAEMEDTKPPATQPVDLKRLLDVTGHDLEMLHQLSRDYMLQAEEILSLIYLAIERRDASELRSLAHKLCGSSSTCGMIAIVESLTQLERMGDAPRFPLAAELQQTAVHELSRIRRFLTVYLAGASSQSESDA